MCAVSSCRLALAGNFSKSALGIFFKPSAYRRSAFTYTASRSLYVFFDIATHHSQPSVTRIDFKAVGLPEYKNCYAVLLDGLFTEQELIRFLSTAESSSPWEVARVNTGPNTSFLNKSYRNGERIIYDSFELSEEIFSKIRPHLSEIEYIENLEWNRGKKKLVKRKMVRMNERLRFLRYQPGGFFRRHLDGPYETPDHKMLTFYTVQLYLPSSSDGSPESRKLPEGGATRFLSQMNGAYYDVDPIPGRVLVFQHDNLLHTGEEIISGVKCAVRCDILYEEV